MAAQYRQLPPDVAKKRQGIIREAERVKAVMASAAPEDRHLHESALAMLGQRHERLLAPYKISAPAAQQGEQGGVTPHGPKHVAKLDTAAEDADAIEASHKVSSGRGVQALDREAIAAADKDKEWSSMTEEQQQAAARTRGPSKPPGVAHSTSTPGAVHQTAMAQAMASAGVTAEPKTSEGAAKAAAPVRVAPGVAEKARRIPTNEEIARNNMAAPASPGDAAVVAGRVATDTPEEREKARKAATRGARGGSKSAEEAAARSSSRRGAASARPAMAGQQFARVGGSGAEVSSAPGRDWITPSQISAPATASVPSAPEPVPAQNTPPAGDDRPAGPMPVIGRRPQKGVIPSGAVSSAPERHWLTPQAANRAKRANAPKEAAEEQPALVPTPAPRVGRTPPPSGPREVSQESNLGPTAQAKVDQIKAQAPAHTTAPEQRTPVSAQQMEHAVSAPEAPVGRSAPKTRGPVTPSGEGGGTGRSGAAPRSPEVGGGRGGGVYGGDYSSNIGGSNYGSVHIEHHVHNVNYGTAGNIGNVEHSGGRGVSGRPVSPNRGPGGPRQHGEDHEPHGDIWYRDVTGTHSLHAGIQHITGQTGGHGEKMPQAKPTGHAGGGTIIGRSGGNQRPIKGSSRAAGQQPNATGPTTGTTTNWTGPVGGGVQMPGSGIGTANPPTLPLPKQQPQP